MTSPARGGDPEGQDDREGTPPLTKEQIEGHISAMKSIIKDHNKRNKANPIRLNFEIEDQDPNEDRIVKGKEIDDEDLSKPFKETLRTPFTRRIIEFSGPEYSMPTNIALYDRSTDPADHLNRFVGAANSGEWPMPVWCRMFQQTLDGSARGWLESLSSNSIDEWWKLREAFTIRYSTRKACYKEPHEITKLVRKANETLTAFKERWTVETGFIIGVPEVMKISSFMDSVKSPELAKRWSRDIHQRLTFPTPIKDDRDGRNSQGKDFRRGDYRNSYKVRDNFNTGRHKDYRAPYPQREQANRAVPKATGNRFRIGKAESLDERPEAEGGKETKQKPSSAEDEPLIIEAEIEGYLVRRVYVDEGSSVEVMFEHCFENLPAKVKVGLRETRTDLVGFAGEVAKPLGNIDLE
ncbi:reverse transcriptase domain-containing protein, partial [Tanacetum coccineum]